MGDDTTLGLQRGVVGLSDSNVEVLEGDGDLSEAMGRDLSGNEPGGMAGSEVVKLSTSSNLSPEASVSFTIGSGVFSLNTHQSSSLWTLKPMTEGVKDLENSMSKARTKEFRLSNVF